MIPDEVMTYMKQIANNKWKVAVLLIAAVIAAYLSLIWLPKDNVIEQEAEEVIKEETGLTVDLTP